MLPLTCNWRSCTSRCWNHWVCSFPGAEWGEKGNANVAQHLQLCQAEKDYPAAAAQDHKAGLVLTCFQNQLLKLQYKIITISMLFSDTLSITEEHTKSRAAALPGKHDMFFAFSHQGKPDNMLPGHYRIDLKILQTHCWSHKTNKKIRW